MIKGPNRLIGNSGEDMFCGLSLCFNPLEEGNLAHQILSEDEVVLDSIKNEEKLGEFTQDTSKDERERANREKEEATKI